jgi:hypothetical protein
MAEQKEKLIEQANKIAQEKGFSKAEIDKLRDVTKIMCGKVLKGYLADLIQYEARKLEFNKIDKKKEKKEESLLWRKYSEYKELIKLINAIDAPNYSGSMDLTFFDEENNNMHIMKIQLSKVKLNYETEIRAPPAVRQELLNQMEKLTEMMMQYYEAIVITNGILPKLSQLFPDDDMSSLSVNKNKLTTCLNESYEYGMGILPYYVDEKGNPIVL